MVDVTAVFRIPRALIALAWLSLAPAALAQDLPPVDQAPPSIAFPDWRLIDRSDTESEYIETFPSAVETQFPANNQVPLRIFIPEPAAGPVPVVLITHYWGAVDLRAERTLAADLNRQGIGAAILTLPYHLTRTPPGYRSGALAIQPDPAQLRQTMVQATLDVRRAIDFLQTRPEFVRRPLGLAGTSLGALVAALGYAVDDRVTHATFVLGGIDLAKILWSSSRVVAQRDALRRRGYSEGRLRDELAAIEPKNYLPRKAAGSTFAVVGRYDTVIPAASSQELVEALGAPKVLNIDTGHYGGIFIERKVLREVSRFFATEFDGRPYVPPARLVAPTIRLGVLASTPGDFDLGAGLDLVHGDVKGSRFGTLFITPRGIQVFAGQTIAQGLSIGIAASVRRVGLGLMWSTIL